MMTNILNGIAKLERGFPEEILNAGSREGGEVPGRLSEWVVKVGHDFEGDGMAEEAESDSATDGQGGGGERYVTEVGHTDGKM